MPGTEQIKELNYRGDYGCSWIGSIIYVDVDGTFWPNYQRLMGLSKNRDLLAKYFESKELEERE